MLKGAVFGMAQYLGDQCHDGEHQLLMLHVNNVAQSEVS
jgi:hypothetical protein